MVENGVIFRCSVIAGGEIFKIAASRFVDVSEEEINLVKENAIPRNTKHATIQLILKIACQYHQVKTAEQNYTNLI